MNSYFYIFKSYYQDSFKSKKSNLLGYKIILFGKENLVLKNKETLLNSLLKNLKCTRNEKERQQSNKMFIWFLCSFPSTQLYICTINNKKYFLHIYVFYLSSVGHENVENLAWGGTISSAGQLTVGRPCEILAESVVDGLADSGGRRPSSAALAAGRATTASNIGHHI